MVVPGYPRELVPQPLNTVLQVRKPISRPEVIDALVYAIGLPATDRSF